DPQLATLARPGRVKRLAGQRVGERGQRPAAVHLGLGPFGLQLVQDAGQLGDLAVVEVELVGQEAQRAADAEAAPETLLVALLVGPAASPHAETATRRERLPGLVPGLVKGVHRLTLLR